ncbi:hypothetical protein COCOBI_13-2190 [Coccomyxa sp. Obi]|nr:hypothetical protein COCOBI_13-2190 [Coccomyxa sp. Obi]
MVSIRGQAELVSDDEGDDFPVPTLFRCRMETCDPESQRVFNILSNSGSMSGQHWNRRARGVLSAAGRDNK